MVTSGCALSGKPAKQRHLPRRWPPSPSAPPPPAPPAARLSHSADAGGTAAPQPVDPAALATDTRTSGEPEVAEPAPAPRPSRRPAPPSRAGATTNARAGSSSVPPAAARRRTCARPPRSRRLSRRGEAEALQDQAQARRQEVQQILDQLQRRNLCRRSATWSPHHELPGLQLDAEKTRRYEARRGTGGARADSRQRSAQWKIAHSGSAGARSPRALRGAQAGRAAGLPQPQPALPLRLHRQQRGAC